MVEITTATTPNVVTIPGWKATDALHWQVQLARNPVQSIEVQVQPVNLLQLEVVVGSCLWCHIKDENTGSCASFGLIFRHDKVDKYALITGHSFKFEG